MAEQQMQHVGDQRISNVWFRIIERPTNLIGYNNLQIDLDEKSSEPSLRQPLGVYSYEDARFYRTYRGRQLKTQQGRLEDPEMLDRITRDIRDSMVGARGWKADYALIVTWERMSYGGAPKVTDMSKYEQAKRWQNTYQMVLATDEIRTYCMLNYANINWTSSSQSGALTRGRGGKQSALVGFNGGNGTGFYQLPFSSEGNSYKLVQFGSTQDNQSQLRIFCLVQPGLARRRVNLINDPREPLNNWNFYDPQVDLEGDLDAWRFYQGGVIQVRAADTWLEDRGDR
ncbi:Nidogen-like protein [Ancylostoma ceylanicum]|uniref:Nidogen-like protein n=1 Tax=Ancylostoma ceylanicum TaxID=53326 RepID=A0A0D6LYF2_9BILA|nr:Nidogen-like protein [Ancylostoma ceylanicum]